MNNDTNQNQGQNQNRHAEENPNTQNNTQNQHNQQNGQNDQHNKTNAPTRRGPDQNRPRQARPSQPNSGSSVMPANDQPRQADPDRPQQNKPVQSVSPVQQRNQPVQNVRQNPQNLQNNPSSQNRSVQQQRQRPAPGVAPKRPAPQNQQQQRPDGQRPGTVKDANMADEFQSGHTRTFDKNPPQQGSNPAAQRSSDGTYHYTGRDIKSSRQRFVDTDRDEDENENFRENQNPNMRRKRPPADSDEDDGNLTVSSNKDKSKNKKNDIPAKRSGFIMSGILKVVLYILGVLVVSGVIAYNIIMVVNDVFAFVVPDPAVEVNVNIPEDADVERISQILYENHLIKYPKVFNLYINYRKKDKNWEFEPGNYPVSTDLNYDELAALFRRKAAAREIAWITIPEGYTIDEIICEFVKNNNIGTEENFIKVLEETDFSEFGYRFLKPLYETELSPDRKYRLEGYLFPDTYAFYRDESELNIIIKFLDNFNSKFTEDCYKKCEILDKTYREATGRGMTIDDVVNLASIIQWEAQRMEDFDKISAVFHNRLSNPANFPKIDSDATVQYTNMELFLDEAREKYRYRRPTGSVLISLLEEDSAYNTYKRNALPPSAICNPGYEAIFAALWPEEKSPNYYFVANVNSQSKDYGAVYYGKTHAEHLANINKARSE